MSMDLSTWYLLCMLATGIAAASMLRSSVRGERTAAIRWASLAGAAQAAAGGCAFVMAEQAGVPPLGSLQVIAAIATTLACLLTLVAIATSGKRKDGPAQPE